MKIDLPYTDRSPPALPLGLRQQDDGDGPEENACPLCAKSRHRTINRLRRRQLRAFDGIVYVRQLRQKLEDDPEKPKYIHTETGIGYRLCAPE